LGINTYIIPYKPGVKNQLMCQDVTV